MTRGVVLAGLASAVALAGLGAFMRRREAAPAGTVPTDVTPAGVDPRFWGSKTAHDLGVSNVPPASLTANLVRLQAAVGAVEAMEGRVYVTSGYRNAVVNAKVGGVASSLHLRGLAVDMEPRPGQTHEQILEAARFVFPFAVMEQDSKSTWIHAELRS